MKQSEDQRGREHICVTGKKYQNPRKGAQPAELKLTSYITYFAGTSLGKPIGSIIISLLISCKS